MFARRWFFLFFSLIIVPNEVKFGSIAKVPERVFSDWSDTSPNSSQITRYDHFSARDERGVGRAHLGANMMAPNYFGLYLAISSFLLKEKKKEEKKREKG